ncbi:TIGR02757 family protein [Mucilaginibacter ginkgonis]|uniref:TIGR02757 family protein n=1 Tax=Mucilaginibacter ginkgonis TaxID=2682091 RepID=A0A6I4HU36_9SPHI|nr:TIGR02757 family protein [Mucilaginibacter ginkgonis]QQL50408.1 TIGR02757 family protein [Mucilaginibacter ginkgonis]
MIHDIKAFLDAKADQYNRPEFIENDPIVIPHSFSGKQDIEIMGFWAAILAWGQRVTIINKCRQLIALMDGTPYDFIMNHREPDLQKLLQFKHRTFNDVDTLYFISFFRYHYERFNSLEEAFIPAPPDPLKGEANFEVNMLNIDAPPSGGRGGSRGWGVEAALNHFREYFFSLPDYPHRTKKHISSPMQKSTCKRLNMFLRWMVRDDDRGVDFGIWQKLKPADLICPCDLHVDRVARSLKLITRKQTDWQTAVELTAHLRELDPLDPVKYDFALFGLGIEEKFGFGL